MARPANESAHDSECGHREFAAAISKQPGRGLVTGTRHWTQIARMPMRKRINKSVFEKSLASRRLGFGVPPLGGSRAMPPQGGTPNHDFQTGSNLNFCEIIPRSRRSSDGRTF